MSRLMVYAGEAAQDARTTRMGGVPLVPQGFSWPSCAACGEPMQFLAQLLPDDVPTLDDALLIFMCQNDPGMCDDWDPTSCANVAMLVSTKQLIVVVPPLSGETLLGAVSAVRFLDSEAVIAEPSLLDGVQDADAIGLIGGEPEWIQGDETPDCPKCCVAMTFVVQLEQGRDHRTAINFGDSGCGYAFMCTACREALFLWQCS